MTFRVIEGGGLATTLEPSPVARIEGARGAIIDRVAAAIWHFQDRCPDPAYATWDEMKAIAEKAPDRAELVKATLAQARAAIAAMRTAAPPEAEVTIHRHLGSDPETAADDMTAMDIFIDAVLGIDQAPEIT